MDDSTAPPWPKLAWQPAEDALTALPEPTANAQDHFCRTTANLDEERRSSMASLGAIQKDVQWKRIRCERTRRPPLRRALRS
jgi:hypothetical protein